MTKGSIEVRHENPSDLFQIGNLIGRGRSSTVYRATMRAGGQAVAIKMVEMNGLESVLRDLQHEISILESTSHPNIVKYFGAYSESNTLWIVMEYCEGGTVENVFKTLNRGLSEDECACVAQSVLRGLAYLHALPVLHRDVKCSNMLITRNGEIRLSDFGVSTELVSKLSQRNSFRGSISWMAPEVLREQPYDGRADVWSLGISLVEMAECSPPHITMHPMYSVMLDREVSRPGLSQTAKWSPEFIDFVSACLQPSQEQRPTAETLLSHPWLHRAKQAHLKKLVNEYFHQLSMVDHDGLSSTTSYPLKMSPTASSRRIDSQAHLADTTKGSEASKTLPFTSLSDISFSALCSKLPSDVTVGIDAVIEARSKKELCDDSNDHPCLQGNQTYKSLLTSMSKQFLFTRDIEGSVDKAKDTASTLEALLK